jgi:dTDP-4-amino-4,6-dideoxygalactose transaminase
MEVKFFDYPELYKKNKKDFLKIFDDVCSRGAFILQNDLKEFESNLAKFLNVKHAIGVADGTNAISLGLRASNIRPGDEIIIASHTYIATASAIHEIGARPIFADIGDDFLLCPKKAERKITAKTKAIMPTQLNGRCCDMHAFEELCRRYDLDLYEDAAQGLGASYRNKMAGTFGKFGTISFYPAKVLGCFGDGGALITNDDSVADFVRRYRDHGRDNDGQVVCWGTNSRLDNLQAAFLDFKLKTYKDDVLRRRELADRYFNGLKNIEEIKLPPQPAYEPNFDVYQNFEAAFNRRDELQNYLSECGVRAIPQWSGKAVHHFDCLGFGKEKFLDLEMTDWFFERCLMLPLNMALTDGQVEYVIKCIKQFYSKMK